MGDYAQEIDLAREIIASIVEKGIRLLALDFDKTIISIHTAGMWRGGSFKLAEHVRSCFKALIEAALENEQLCVCIVTYSMQPALIKEVLKMVLPESNTDQVIIRASSKDWVPASGHGAADGSHYLGKQQHIAWITTELYNTRHLMIEPHEILLLDDDDENVGLARDFGHQAYEVPEDVTIESLNRFASQMVVTKRQAIIS